MLLAAALKVCALLTAADLTAVMGEAPTKGRASTPHPSASQCVYALPKSAASVTVEVTRDVPAQQFLERLRGAWENEREEAGEHEQLPVEAVDGLGEQAFFAIGSGMGSLYVWQRKTLLRVSIQNSDTDETRLDKLRRLARRALSRFPK